MIVLFPSTFTFFPINIKYFPGNIFVLELFQYVILILLNSIIFKANIT